MQKLIIVNDRYGFNPMYYACSNGKLLISSEVKAILEDSSFETDFQKASRENEILLNNAEHIDQRNEQRRFLLNGLIIYKRKMKVRIPFCDYDLTDFMLSLPPKLRYGKHMLIELMKREYPHLANIPWERTGLPLYSSGAQRWLRNRYQWMVYKMAAYFG